MRRIIWLILLCILYSSLYSVYHKRSYYDADEFVTDIVFYNSYAFLTQGSEGIEIINIVDPDNPEFVNSYDTEDCAIALNIKDNYLFISDDSNLEIIDISDVQNLNSITTYFSPSLDGIGLIAISDNLIFVPVGQDGIHVLDISDINDPTFITSIQFQFYIYKVKKFGDFLIAFGSDSTWLIDITDIYQPSILMEYEISLIDNDATIDLINNVLFIADSFYGITLFDISESSNIFEITNYDINGGRIFVDDSILYIFVVGLGYYYVELDVSNLIEPIMQNYFFCPLAGSGLLFKRENNLSFFSGGSGVEIVDMSNSQNSYLAGSLYYDPHYWYRDFFIENERMYFVKGGSAGCLMIFDINDPENPILLNTFQIENLYKIIVKENIAYVISHDDENYLQIIDVSNALDPVLMGNLQVSGTVYSLDIYDSHIFAVTRSDNVGLDIINVTDPENPVLVTHSDIPEFPMLISVKDGIAFVADGYAGLKIIDVNDPTTPILLSSYNEPTASLSVDNDIVYLSVYPGYHLVDVSDLTNPILLSEIEIIPSWDPFYLLPPQKIGNNLLLSDTIWNEIYTYDVSNSLNPEFISKYSWNLSSGNWKIHENYLIALNSTIGISILSLEAFVNIHENVLPQMNEDLINYPNPFNPSTTIKFTTEHTEENTEIIIYNLKGQKVKQLSAISGQQSVAWNGTDENDQPVSSGIYFYKLNIQNSPVKKMLLLK